MGPHHGLRSNGNNETKSSPSTFVRFWAVGYCGMLFHERTHPCLGDGGNGSDGDALEAEAETRLWISLSRRGLEAIGIDDFTPGSLRGTAPSIPVSLGEILMLSKTHRCLSLRRDHRHHFLGSGKSFPVHYVLQSGTRWHAVWSSMTVLEPHRVLREGPVQGILVREPSLGNRWSRESQL
jgi:hypothetical protein